MHIRRLAVGLIIVGSAALLGTRAARAQAQTNIAPQAERILAAACRYLAETPYFSLGGEICREHVTDSGQKLEFSRTISMEVKRPNKLHLETASPHSQRGFWYDGKSLTILDREPGFFSMATMPGTLDAMIDKAHDDLGVDMPLVDLAVSDPYKNATAKVVKGTYYGLSPVLGVDCHHLAFTQDNVDWQIWIQEGPQPLIRKFVITHKGEEGAPAFTALITQWNLTDRISDFDFVFEPPRGATQVQMRSDQAGNNQGERGKPLATPKSK